MLPDASSILATSTISKRDGPRAGPFFFLLHSACRSCVVYVAIPATIVEIDQKSLAALGQWPWPRLVFAKLIRDINRHQPAAIGIDILMPEADGQSLERLVARTGNSFVSDRPSCSR